MSQWKKVRIGDFLTESKIIAEQSDADHRITVRLNCKGIEKRDLKAEKEGATKYYIRKAGQFIYGKQNIHKGAFGIIPKELDGYTSSADLPSFDFDLSKCNPEWLCLCLKVDERYKKLQKNVKGVGSQRLAVNVFLDEEIPLPDLQEQNKIILKVSETVSKAENLLEEIESQKEYVKFLRQNILQDAIEGKLTADWRKSHPVINGNPDYDAEALFEKIQKEKESDKKQRPLSQITEKEEPFEIPEGWKWVRLGELVIDITSGSREWAKYYSNHGALFLRMGNLSKDSFHLRLNNLQYVNVPDNSEGKRTRLQPGDLLFSITADIGNLGLIPENFEEAYINQHTARIRFQYLERTKFLPYVLLSPFLKKQYLPNAHGMKNSFRLDTLSFLKLPLPPLAEQTEIIYLIENKLAKVDQLEIQIREREIYAKQLMQSILKDAF